MAVVVQVFPNIDELSEVLTDIPCPEEGCNSVLPNSSCLEMHLIKTHKKESKYLEKHWEEISFQFFCPIEGCKYHCSPQKNSNQLRWFSKMKFIKQHYLKVHMKRSFPCSICNKKFFSERTRQAHIDVGCQKVHKCLQCSATYHSLNALRTHTKRKGHCLPLSPLRKPKRDQDQFPLTILSTPPMTQQRFRPLASKEVITSVPLKHLCVTKTYPSPKGSKRVDASVQCLLISNGDGDVESDGGASGGFLSSRSVGCSLLDDGNSGVCQANSVVKQTIDTGVGEPLSESNICFPMGAVPSTSGATIVSSNIDRPPPPPSQSPPFLDTLHTLLDIETQTEWLEDYDYNHTQTQTYRNLFDELVEFADIETQTAWQNGTSIETQTVF